MPVDVTNLNGAVFNALDSSLFVETDGHGLTINGDGTYTVTPTGIGLATYDNWVGSSITNPDPSDTVAVTTFIPGIPTPGIVEYTLTDGDGSVNPATGGIGAEVVGWNSTGVLLEQLTGYIPGTNAIIEPDGAYFILQNGGDLSVVDGSVSPDQTFTFGTTGPFPTFTALCFLTGAGIATPTGETAVESLAVGDLVLTASGVARPIVWIGKGKVLTERGQRNAATPVILRRGALGDNMPHRDLRVTKGHSFYLDGVLIPAEFLVNHRSILWDDHSPREVTLYHIELATHDVLLANGAPAESYRDDGNRWLFQNSNSGWDQPAKAPFAPVLTGGPIVDAVWRRLLDLAGARPGLILTDETDLHLLVNGDRVDAEQSVNGAHVFRLPVADQITTVRIVSRAAAPDELGLARDPRSLGVALRRVVLRKGSRSRIVNVADDRLVEGFHGYEPDCGIRWTDGDAALPIDLFEDFAKGAELVLQLAGTARYVADVRCQEAA
jgi:hypothetical protein